MHVRNIARMLRGLLRYTLTWEGSALEVPPHTHVACMQ